MSFVDVSTMHDKMPVMLEMDRQGALIPPSRVELAAMDQSLQLAREAAAAGDVPVGALVLNPQGEVISAGRNTRAANFDPAGHAEITAMREACARLDSTTLSGCTLVVTLEPCTMCAGALLAARVSHLVFGAWEEKTGAVGSVYDIVRDGRLPYPVPTVVGGVREAEAIELLQAFFQDRR